MSAALLLAAAIAAADAPSLAQREKVLASLVQITASQCADGKDRSGSGFALDAGGRIVTAHHVVGGCGRILVSYEGIKPPAPGKRLGRVVRVLAAGDLGLLEVADPPAVPGLRLATQPPARNASFSGFGYPLGTPTAGDQLVTFSVGASRLSDVLPPALADELRASGSRIDLQRAVLRFNVALQPGMSGGPIVDAAGEVIGVVAGGLRAGAAPASWGWPGDGVRQLLASSEPADQAVRLTAAHYSLQDIHTLNTALQRGRRLRCGDLEFVDAGVRTLAELLPGTDDAPRVQYILGLLNQDPAVIGRERFQLWLHRDSGATAVVPAEAQLTAAGGPCVARSASGVFEQVVWGAVAAGAVGVQIQPLRFEQQIVAPRLGLYANPQFDPHLTTGVTDPATGRYMPIPQTRPNGLVFARRAQFMQHMPSAPGLPARVSHAFETLVARNDSFLGVATFNRDRPPLIDTCMSAPTTAMCRAPMAHLQEWLRYILATQLSTYPTY